MAVEEVPREAEHDAHLGGLLGRDEADLGDLGDTAGGDDGSDHEEEKDAENERYHDRDDAVQLAEAQHVERICSLSANIIIVLDDAVEDEDPVCGEKDEKRRQARRLQKKGTRGG